MPQQIELHIVRVQNGVRLYATVEHAILLCTLSSCLWEHLMHVKVTRPNINNISHPFLQDSNRKSFEGTPEGPQREVRKAHHQRHGLKQLR